MKYFIVIGLFTLIQINLDCFSQELVSSNGDCFLNDFLEIDWSLGEIVIETANSGDICFTQGFHQPTILNKTDKKYSYVKIIAIPNPFDLYLVIDLKGVDDASGYYGYLFDMSGKLTCIFQNLMLHNEINTEDIPVGQYILKVFNSHNREFKSIKIIKVEQP